MGIALIMVSAVVAIYFTVEDMTAVLGLLTGVLVADAEGRGRGRRATPGCCRERCRGLRLRVVLACDFFLRYSAMLAGAMARAGAGVKLLTRDHDLEFGGSPGAAGTSSSVEPSQTAWFA